MCSSPTLLLAGPHGDPLVRSVAAEVDTGGVPVAVVDLDPRGDDDAAHETNLRARAASLGGSCVLGGFSLGARIAAQLCPELAPHGLLCLGYPFHHARQPEHRHGLEALLRVRTPTLVIQGTRDVHGTEAEVRGYRLPEHVELLWLPDGNHRFVPRVRSGLSERQHIEAAASAAVSFMAGRGSVEAQARGSADGSQR